MAEPTRIDITCKIDDLLELPGAFKRGTTVNRRLPKILVAIKAMAFIALYSCCLILLHQFPLTFSRSQGSVNVKPQALWIVTFLPSAYLLSQLLTPLIRAACKPKPVSNIGIRQYEFIPPAPLSKSRRNTNTVLAFFCAAVVIALNFAPAIGNKPPNWADPVFLCIENMGLVGLIIYYTNALRVKQIGDFRSYQSQPTELFRPRSAEIDDDGITIFSEQTTLIAKWKAYSRFVETKNLFVLFASRGIHQVLPRRGFSEEQYRRLRVYAINEIGNGWLLESESFGFPVQPMAGEITGPAHIALPPVDPAQ